MIMRLLVRLFGERATKAKHGAEALPESPVELWVLRERFYELPRPCTQSTCDGWDDPDSRCPRRPRDCKRFS